MTNTLNLQIHLNLSGILTFVDKYCLPYRILYIHNFSFIYTRLRRSQGKVMNLVPVYVFKLDRKSQTIGPIFKNRVFVYLHILNALF